MPPSWESSLERWTEAGLLDPATADRIRAWESGRGRGGALRWPARLALGLGGLLLAAGVLLFVAAHWDSLSPGQRFALLLAAVAGFHLAGALADRFPPLALTLHACGSVALGGGIFLAGQIFHLEEHWPGGFMLWAAGAWIGWALRRDWAQGALAALLTPAWLTAEWLVATEHRAGAPALAVGLLGLALAYLGAESGSRGRGAGLRRALVWIGGLALIPTAVFLLMAADNRQPERDTTSGLVMALGWLGALAIPSAVAWATRGRAGWPVGAGLAWGALGILAGDLEGVVPYLWAAALAVGLIAWGVLDRRTERVNLGIAGFAVTVAAFYFSNVMDKLGRSASLIGLGLLFLGGGYLLERARRKLLAGIREAG